MSHSPYAGKTLPHDMLVDLPLLIDAYYNTQPNPTVPEQSVSFGTSGHRGSSFNGSFNEQHVLAISQAICDYRKSLGTDGPLFLGIDTHALSEPAQITAVEVLAANGVTLMLAKGGEYTPTPAISHAILTHNQGRTSGLADGIVITPSHNPPDNGGFKYNPTNGGPADSEITTWIQNRANQLLRDGLRGVKRLVYQQALKAEPLDEALYRTGMRLAYVQGDVEGAKELLKRCAAMTRREFGSEPAEETLALAAAIDRGQPLPVSSDLSTVPLPHLRLLQVVASGEGALRVEEIAAVLERPSFDVAADLGTLEGQGLVNAHLAVASAYLAQVLTSTPVALRRLLHERIAEVLVAGGMATITFGLLGKVDDHLLPVALVVVDPEE